MRMKIFKKKLLTDQRKRNIKRWLDALESGEFKQGTFMYVQKPGGRVLLTEDVNKEGCLFCALGVAAYANGENATAIQPWEFTNLIGLSDEKLDEVIYMNDMDNLPLLEIAKELREDLARGGIEL